MSYQERRTANAHMYPPDMVDEIRRHLRSLSKVIKNGEGNIIHAGEDLNVPAFDAKEVKEDLRKALEEVKMISKQLDESGSSKKK